MGNACHRRDDAFVASLLCDKGHVRHKPQAGLDAKDNWMHTEVTPNIKERFENDIPLCQVLGTARLWSVFDDEASLLLPQDDVARIRHSFQGDIEGNPVTKTLLEIMRVGARLQTVHASLE